MVDFVRRGLLFITVWSFICLPIETWIRYIPPSHQRASQDLGDWPTIRFVIGHSCMTEVLEVCSVTVPSTSKTAWLHRLNTGISHCYEVLPRCGSQAQQQLSNPSLLRAPCSAVALLVSFVLDVTRFKTPASQRWRRPSLPLA